MYIANKVFLNRPSPRLQVHRPVPCPYPCPSTQHCTHPTRTVSIGCSACYCFHLTFRLPLGSEGVPCRHQKRCCMRSHLCQQYDLQMLTVRPNPGRQALAEPYLAVMDSVPATLRIGIHIRMGDSAVANAKKKGDKRYGPGCD